MHLKGEYVFVSNDILQNAKQNLELCRITKVGIVQLVIEKNELQIYLSICAASNNEKYTENENPSRFITQGLTGVDFNTFHPDIYARPFFT